MSGIAPHNAATAASSAEDGRRRDLRSSALPEPRSTSRARRARVRRRVWGGVGLIAVALYFHAAQRRDCGPASGEGLNPPPTSAAAGAAAMALAPRGEGRFRVGAFNIHGGKGTDGQRDLGRIAGLIGDCDFVGLHEVHGPMFWQSRNQAEDLAHRLGVQGMNAHWLFAPSVQRWHHFEFGNGLLSRLPVESWERMPLPRVSGNTHHNMVLSRVDVGGQRVQVLSVHLHRKDEAERQRHLRIACDWFRSLQPPAILMGDLNTKETDPVLQLLLAEPDVEDALTGRYHGFESKHVDWILVRGLTVHESACVQNDASDHPFLWADLSVPASP